MTATHDVNPTIPTIPVLYLSLELGQKNWKLAFTIGLGQKPRLRTIAARDTEALMAEIGAAKKRFGHPEDAAVASCYEAGRNGFWLHRFLLCNKVEDLVVDSSSIEVNRRKRRARSYSLRRRTRGQIRLRRPGTGPMPSWWCIRMTPWCWHATDSGACSIGSRGLSRADYIWGRTRGHSYSVWVQ